MGEDRRVTEDAMQDENQNMGCLPSPLKDVDSVCHGMDDRPFAQLEEATLHHGGVLMMEISQTAMSDRTDNGSRGDRCHG